jgi:uncharacterized DUF497 family protein
VRITYDPAKREKTLRERGIDFADALEVFAGRTLTIEDDRQDYGETRYITIGYLRTRMVALVWTPRGNERRIISMRHCNDREKQRYDPALG